MVCGAMFCRPEGDQARSREDRIEQTETAPESSKIRRQKALIRYSTLSFAFDAAFVCHCMLPGESPTPRFSGLM